MQKLKEEFVQNGGTWKEFKIDEIFEKIKTQVLKYKVKDLPIQKDSCYNLPALTAGILNQGLSCYVPRSNATILRNVISVSANGANSGVMFYQPDDFTILQDSYAIKPKSFTPTKRQYLYILGALQKTIRGNYNWVNKAGWERIKSKTITLPFINGNIAFDYMERYISELEEERISELAAYLKVTGLENCVLTKPEKLALKSRGGGNLRKFKIVDLFTVKNTHSILNSWIVPNSGVYPYVTAGESNNSILTYINYDSAQLEDENAILIGGKTTVITYQEKEFFSNDSHNLALYLKDSSNVSKNVSLFLITSLSKALKPIYSWGNSISKRKIQKDYISLPATKTGTPDYEFMETYIRALEKVVIKGVVDWKDSIIKTTKEIVYRQ